MDVVCFSETLVATCESVLRRNADKQRRHLYRCEKLKSLNVKRILILNIRVMYA
jgi:hypothetical protein